MAERALIASLVISCSCAGASASSGQCHRLRGGRGALARARSADAAAVGGHGGGSAAGAAEVLLPPSMARAKKAWTMASRVPRKRASPSGLRSPDA